MSLALKVPKIPEIYREEVMYNGATCFNHLYRRKKNLKKKKIFHIYQ